MIRIRFLKGWRMYQPGEVAAFDETMSDQLVAGGFAELADEAEAAPKKGAAKALAKPEAKETEGKR